MTPLTYASANDQRARPACSLVSSSKTKQCQVTSDTALCRLRAFSFCCAICRRARLVPGAANAVQTTESSLQCRQRRPPDFRSARRPPTRQLLRQQREQTTGRVEAATTRQLMCTQPAEQDHWQSTHTTRLQVVFFLIFSIMHRIICIL